MTLEEFIKSRIESVDDLRTLLLFHKNPQSAMDANAVAGELYLPPAVAARVLARLCAKDLLAVSPGEGRFRYHPATEEIERLVVELVELDRSRPVSLINLIYHPSGRKIMAFADAFKITKDKEK